MAQWKCGEVILGEYTIEKELGRGGMGRVWLVKSQSTGRRFAVKQTLLKDEKNRKAFLSELQTWIDLPEHPNIVPCRFFRTVGDEIVIFADYIEGGSLADWIAKGKLTGLEQILDVAIQFAWGLHAIHERGLVHQDVKPGNVLMTPEGVPMVTDFGLARARLRSPDGAFVSPALPPGPIHQSVLVSSGGMTPAYASPEQRNGKPLSRKTDIWSWGVSILDMFMGGVSCPHGGHIAFDVLVVFIADGQQDVRLPGMPNAVADVLRKCFAHTEDSRWSDMRLAADELAASAGCSRRLYATKEPSADDRPISAFLRRDYTGGGWSDPQEWLRIAEAAVRKTLPNRPPASAPSHLSRAALAVSDLVQYKEVLHTLSHLASAGNPSITIHLCSLCFQMAQIHSELNDLPGAIAAFDESIRYARILRSVPSMHTYADMALANALDQKALRWRMCGELDNALDCYNEAIGCIRQSLAVSPDDASLAHSYGHTLTNTAIALRYAGSVDAAIRYYDAAIATFSKLVDRTPSFAYSEYNIDLQRALSNKGVALRKAQRIREAMQCYDQAMAILIQMGSIRNDSKYLIEVARLHARRACLMPPADAVTEFKKAVSLYERIVREYAMDNVLADLADAHASCSSALSACRRVEEAVAECDASLRAWDKVVRHMGKNQYADRYYNTRLMRLSLSFQSGNNEVARSDAAVLVTELSEAIAATGRQDLIALYHIGLEHGYWQERTGEIT